MSDNESKNQIAETPKAPEVQTLTPENSAAWVEKYVAWASRVLDRKAADTRD
jgi:hypothetical protein